MPRSHQGNVFDNIPANLPDELFQTLVSRPGIRIERIVSNGHASPPDFWYDQEEHEWVLVVSGAARLEFEGTAEAIEMQPGAFIDIPAHCRHRVEWTDPQQATVWLAIFYRDM